MRGWAAVLLALGVLAATLMPARVDAQRGRSRSHADSPPPQTAPADDDSARAGPYGFNTRDVIEAVGRGEGPQALEAYQTAAADAEKAGDLGRAVRGGAAAAMVARRLGMQPKTLAHATRVIELGPKAPPSFEVNQAVLVAYTLAARVHRSLGDLPGARRLLDEALTVSRSGPLAAGGPRLAAPRALVLVVLSQVEVAQGDRAAAHAHAQEAVQLLQRAESQRGRGRPRAAFARQTAAAYVQAARLAIADRRLDDAAAALAQAAHYNGLTKVAEQEIEIATLGAQVALDRGDAAGALALATNGRARAAAIGLGVRLTELDRIIAYAQLKLGNFDAALAAAESALARIEDARAEFQDPEQRAGFFEKRQGLYHAAVHMALRAGKAEEGLAIAERSRSRAFLDLLGSANLSKGKTHALAQEELRLRARLAEAAAALAPEDDDESEGGAGTSVVRAQMAAAERGYRAFLARVRAEDVEQASLMAVEPVTVAEIQALLPDDTMLLEYLVSGQDVVVWMVDRRRVEVRRIAGDRATLLADVRDFRAAIASQAPLPEIERRAEALYGKLVGPASPLIRGSRRLVIVPHDVLHYLPFGALRTPAGKWLVEAHALATVPSASVLKFLVDKGAQASDRVLAVGNPDLGPALALRYAEREARAVGERYPTTSTVLTQADASKRRVKQLAGQSGLLHFAVHGELNETDPMASALLLAPGPGDDGRLEVRELFQTELDARLVVLSACETGLGKLSRGDELVGLQRAFLYAGAPDVVTTLWKVDDRASYMLMRAFYADLPTKGPMEALRAAQRGLMVDFPHPFAWAAFVLTGVPH